MNGKNLQKILNTQTKELKEGYARQGKFLLEQFDKRTQIIAEVQVEQGKKIEHISQKLDATFDIVGNLTVEMKILNGRVDKLESRMGKLESRMGTIEAKVDKLDQNIEFIKEEIRLIRHELKGKIDRDEFIALEKRVIFLEKKVNRLV